MSAVAADGRTRGRTGVRRGRGSSCGFLIFSLAIGFVTLGRAALSTSLARGLAMLDCDFLTDAPSSRPGDRRRAAGDPRDDLHDGPAAR